jgi:heme oxygenase
MNKSGGEHVPIPPAGASLSALAALREATWPCHQRLEKRINFKARLASRADYRAHLEQMWGFHAALEPQLGSGLLDLPLGDYPQRRKLRLLESDLQALGATPAALALLPRCLAVPACEDTAAAFGCAYVLEGATLGGQTLMPLVHTRLGLTPEHGAAFLASYGAAVAAMWRRFGDALERHCPAGPERLRAASAATATFTALEAWLCGATV